MKNIGNANKPIISIITPVYNGEKYLCPCIDSIINQTYQNWELLLIDDGSTDKSGKICDMYASRDRRISVIHKKNEGQAVARNEGLNIIQGEYVCFVDCDDWLEPEMYATMLQTLKNEKADIVICGYAEDYLDGFTKKNHAEDPLTTYDAQEAVKMLLSGKIGSYLWSMLFKREVVQEPMPILNQYEDHATIFKWMLHAHRITVLNQIFYHYRQLPSSSIHSYNPNNGDNFFQAIKERYYYIAENNLLPGWEQENRRLYLRGCIKLTKDLARMPNYDIHLKNIIIEVCQELKRFLPITKGELGGKYYLRLKLLLWDIDVFVRIMRISSAFSLSQRRKGKKMKG